MTVNGAPVSAESVFQGGFLAMKRLLAALALACAIVPATAAPLGPDGAAGRTLPGKFVWFDLATEDPAAARAFYGAVFGWKFRDARTAAMPYTVIEHAGGKLGGLFHASRPAGAAVGARWLSLVSVPDAAKAARYVRDAGGQVVVPPRAVAGRGTHAVFRDPEGAVFGVLAAEEGDPPDAPVADGDVFWLDLFARDPAKAARFYAGLAGYEVSEPDRDAGIPRWILATGGYARAGIALLRSEATKPGWLPYILVDDVAGTVRRAVQAGGRVVVEPRAGLLDGNVAIVADPSGGVVGVVNWVAPAAAQGGGR